jgi:hypothetical protein
MPKLSKLALRGESEVIHLGSTPYSWILAKRYSLNQITRRWLQCPHSNSDRDLKELSQGSTLICALKVFFSSHSNMLIEVRESIS